MGIAVEFKSVNKRFSKASYDAVSAVTLAIDEGEIVTILGTSGCGKTTLLKMVNRLYEPDSGEIFFFGELISSLNAVELRRKIGYVIQQVGLFPHMTIGENIATVPKILGWSKPEDQQTSNRAAGVSGTKPSRIYSTLSRSAFWRTTAANRFG